MNLLRALCVSTCVTMLPACASSVAGDGGRDVIVATDDGVATDATTRSECINVRECALQPRPTGEVFGTAFSCVANACVFNPVGGATCAVASDGCMQCDTQLPSACPGSPCLVTIDPSTVMRGATNCSRDLLGEIDTCFGQYVRLRDGSYCVLSYAPTGAIRYVLSCGACEVVFEM